MTSRIDVALHIGSPVSALHITMSDEQRTKEIGGEVTAFSIAMGTPREKSDALASSENRVPQRHYEFYGQGCA